MKSRLPYNEFSEVCTGDMPDADVMWHNWMQDKWEKQRKQYNKNNKIEERDEKTVRTNRK
jgi:hypothetical protein